MKYKKQRCKLLFTLTRYQKLFHKLQLTFSEKHIALRNSLKYKGLKIGITKELLVMQKSSIHRCWNI